MPTDAEIASLALTRVGHEPIASFSASGDKAQRWFAANYSMIRQALLREHQWRFATKRDVLVRDTVHTVTGVTDGNPVVVTTEDAHGFSNGDIVYLAGLIGPTSLNNRTFTAANVTGTTLELSGEDGTGNTAYASGGALTGYVASEYAYRFALPSDCLRLLRINGAERDDYRVEQDHVVSNEGTCNIEYIFDQDDETAFDGQFVDLLAARLSAEVCFYLTDNATLTEQTWQIYNNKLSLARTMDSRQGKPRGIEADQWLKARV